MPESKLERNTEMIERIKKKVVSSFNLERGSLRMLYLEILNINFNQTLFIESLPCTGQVFPRRNSCLGNNAYCSGCAENGTRANGSAWEKKSFK